MPCCWNIYLLIQFCSVIFLTIVCLCVIAASYTNINKKKVIHTVTCSFLCISSSQIKVLQNLLFLKGPVGKSLLLVSVLFFAVHVFTLLIKAYPVTLWPVCSVIGCACHNAVKDLTSKTTISHTGKCTLFFAVRVCTLLIKAHPVTLQLILCQLDVGGWRKEKGMRLTLRSCLGFCVTSW